MAVRILLFVFTSYFGAVQAQNFKMEIGDKTISFLLDEKIQVHRTVSDTLIRCKSSMVKKFPMGTNSAVIEISPSEFKTLHREIFNDKGCIWTRITNDEIYKDGWGAGTYPIFLYDSVTTVKRPRECWHINTVMQINPITLGEDIVVDIDSESLEKYNLANISHSELARAISAQFGLTRQMPPLPLHSITLLILNQHCDWINIDYRNSQSIEEAIKKINDIKAGAQVIISSLKFENTSGHMFGAGQVNLHDIAVMTLTD